MDWNPKDWTWAPRLDRGFAWACRTLRAALAFAPKAPLHIDRRNFRAMWAGLGWAPRNYVKVLAVAFLVLLPFWVWMIAEVWGEIRTLTGDTIPKASSDDLRNIAYALGVTITALAGLLVAPLILIRTWVSERNATTAEQGLITDRFTRAVEQLGAEKTIRRREFKPLFKVDAKGKWARDTDGNPVPATRPDGTPLGEWESVEETLPNLEVRLGAIYALERIAQDSERDHIPIMETLCAYVRQNAPGSAAKDHDLGEWVPLPDDAGDEDSKAHLARRKARFGTGLWDSKAWKWARGLAAPRADIQAALTVIGRRPEERIAHERRRRAGGIGGATGGEAGFRLDLRGANLQRSDLTGLDLARALLTGTRLEGADLGEARLEGAHLWEARLEGAHLWGARLEGARLWRARLEGADLGWARLEGANLRWARLEGADLGGARLEGANLAEARLEGANLQEARLEGANLRWARLEGADLREAWLEGADLREARLEGAMLQSANLKSADLTDWTCNRASLRSADLTDAKHLTQDQINAAFGDSAAILPDGIVMPDHWDDETIGPDDPDPKYQAWLAAGAPPGEPRQAPPKPANTPSPPPPD
jgi:uncharacterized protein YjbI with pentapeptide repeats